MKSEKGITLISLTVYIIAMSIVVAVVATISKYFYTNTKSLSENIDPITEYTKFNSFFTDEVNHENIKVLECKTEYENPEDTNTQVNNSYIVFDNGIQYTFIKENKGIYRNKTKICSDVNKCVFEYGISNGKYIVKVKMKIQNKEKEATFTLRN